MLIEYKRLAKQTVLLQKEYGLTLDDFMIRQIEMYERFYGKKFNEIAYRCAVNDEVYQNNFKAGAV